MKEKNNYMLLNPVAQIIAVPFLLSRIIKGKKIKELIYEKIDFTREESAKCTFSEIERFEKGLEYENLDNFFVNHFRKVENSLAHTFEDKINYCLNRYSVESRKILTAANLVVLEENFLNGAEKALFLYFSLKNRDKVDKSFKNLFSSDENYFVFISVMKNNSYLNDVNRIDIPKIFFAGILTFLRSKGVLKNVKDTEIVTALNFEFDFTISKASLCNGVPHPTNESEKKLFDEFAKQYIIKY